VGGSHLREILLSHGLRVHHSGFDRVQIRPRLVHPGLKHLRVDSGNELILLDFGVVHHGGNV
jgi:hypothetical protein